MGKVDLSTILSDLKFDKLIITTENADEYINTHGGTFRCINFEPEKTFNCMDGGGHVIECATGLSSETLFPDASTFNVTESWTVLSERLKKLAAEIKEKSDLFCQLEWFIRNIPIENTKESINLIIKNLLHASVDWKAAYIEEGMITMDDNTPMLVLGFVAQIFKICDTPIILSTKETAVICHLFTELCQNVGWNVQLILIRELNILKDMNKSCKVYQNFFNGLSPEITGIVTEQSDVDSAVDVFLNAGSHPMPLTRIIVQESVYEEFKNILAWKCKLNHETKEYETELNTRCTDVLKYGNKLFFMNYAGNNIEHKPHRVVLVESYRTTKELLLLVPKYNQLCLSIWASHVSEANEIALNADVPIVWVNDFCNFAGPDEVSKPIYKRLDSVNIAVRMNTSVVQMMKKQQNWSKNTFTERCDAILKVIKSIDLSLGDKIEPEILNWKINNFITVHNDMLILGFNIPENKVIYNTVGTVAVPSPSFDNIIRALVNGTGVIIASNPKNEEEIFNAFEEEGIPVAFLDETETNELQVRVPLGDSWCFQTKVIWTNFGTTFAN